MKKERVRERYSNTIEQEDTRAIDKNATQFLFKWT
jgi:hypothetical protein